MTLNEFKARHPGITISGEGRYLVLACGAAKLYRDLAEAKAAKAISCGATCAGVVFHAGFILSDGWMPDRNRKWLKFCEADD